MSDRIPEGWVEQTLGDIATVIMGQSPSSSTYNTDGNGLPFYQGKADFGNHYPVTRMWCSEPTKVAQADSILFSVRAPVGDVNITKEKCCIGRGLSAVVGKQMNQALLYQNLIHSKSKFQLLAQGSTFEAINGNEMREFRLLLPPKPEQQKIASILTSVDEVIEKTESQISKLQDLKKGMMQELLTKGIGHTEFKDSPVGRMPVGWSVLSFSQICSSKYGIVDGPFGSNLKTEHYRESGVPVFQSGFVTSNKFVKRPYVYVDNKKYQEQIRSSAGPNDILMAKIGMNAGACAIIPSDHQIGILAGNSLKMTVNKEIASNYYILSLLHLMQYTGEIRRMLTETAQPAISITNLKKLKTALPPLAEQSRISDSLKAFDSRTDLVTSRLESCRILKKALMQDLLTGKVRVKVN